MNLKSIFSLLLLIVMITFISCGKEEPKPELEKVESVDDLIQELDDSANKADDVIITQDTSKAVAGNTPQQTAPAAEDVVAAPVSSDYSKKPLQGTVVSLNDIVMGGNGKINKQAAQSLVASGNFVVLKAVDGNIYFVYNEDGTFASKRLAGYANNEKVGLLGKAKTIDGINVFIMNLIEAM